MFAAAAAVPTPGPAADWLDGLGVTAGRSVSTFPPGLGPTSGSDPPCRPAALRLVLARPAVPAAAPANAEPLAVDVAGTTTVITAVVVTGVFGFGLEAVAATVSLMCSPFVADVGTTSAAWSSILPEVPTLPSLHVRLPSPLPQTVKCEVADVGFELRETVTPLDVAPDDDTEIVKYAVPPGLTFELPGATLTPWHSFTGTGLAAMKTASEAVGEADALEDALEDGLAEAEADGVGLGGDVDPPPPADPPPVPPLGDVLGVDAVGVGEELDVGEVVGAVELDEGAGVGVKVEVTQGVGVAAALAVAVLCNVSPVVPSIAATTHSPVAAVAKADPCLRTLTRLTPFLRSSREVPGSRRIATLCLTRELS